MFPFNSDRSDAKVSSSCPATVSWYRADNKCQVVISSCGGVRGWDNDEGCP